MKLKVTGTYRTEDLPTLSQHNAVQLEAMGVAGFAISGLYLQGFDAQGRRVELRQAGEAVDVVVSVNPDAFERPVITASRVEAVPVGQANTQAKRRALMRRQFKKPY